LKENEELNENGESAREKFKKQILKMGYQDEKHRNKKSYYTACSMITENT
jgi:hypothetical protein